MWISYYTPPCSCIRKGYTAPFVEEYTILGVRKSSIHTDEYPHCVTVVIMDRSGRQYTCHPSHLTNCTICLYPMIPGVK